MNFEFEKIYMNARNHIYKARQKKSQISEIKKTIERCEDELRNLNRISIIKINSNSLYNNELFKFQQELKKSEFIYNDLLYNISVQITFGACYGLQLISFAIDGEANSSQNRNLAMQGRSILSDVDNFLDDVVLTSNIKLDSLIVELVRVETKLLLLPNKNDSYTLQSLIRRIKSKIE